MVDSLIDQDLTENWSDLTQHQAMPEIDHQRLQAYRQQRIREAMLEHDVALCIVFNPISMRYIAEYRNYALFQAHIPSAYLFVPVDGAIIMHGAYDPSFNGEMRQGRHVAYFDGAGLISHEADKLADDIRHYLNELGSDNYRIAVEYANPSITQALEKRGLEVIDGVLITEQARVIKSDDEVDCIRWAIAVAELGFAKVKQAIKPGVSELQLWGLLNYTNIANDGDWHDGRMLASGPRINPWLQEVSNRRIESGDLVGFDTDMIGPFGYFADVSRTMHCGPAKPTARQKQLYQTAVAEIDHNLSLLKPGLTLHEFQRQAWPTPEEFQKNAYSCVIHGAGMCDEYPQVKHLHRMPQPYAGTLEAGMVICVESYIGAEGERDGVKLEQQVLMTDDGYEMLTSYPYEESLLT